MSKTVKVVVVNSDIIQRCKHRVKHQIPVWTTQITNYKLYIYMVIPLVLPCGIIRPNHWK